MRERTLICIHIKELFVVTIQFADGSDDPLFYFRYGRLS
jgi:hypothetical protein